MSIFRIALRVLIRVGAVLAVLAAAGLVFYSFFLPGIAESEVLAALRDLGLPNATAKVGGIGPDQASLTDVDLDGTGRIRAESIVVEYRLGEVKDGRVRRVTVTGLTFTLRYADGRLDLGPLADLKSESEKDAVAELPFTEIRLRACRLIVDYQGDVHHFPVEGTLRNAGKGELDFALTSRFEEQPVVLTGRVATHDLAADVSMVWKDVRATVDYRQIYDTLDFSLAGRRNRLSLYLGDRHLVGDRLDLHLSGKVKEGKLTRATVVAAADRVEFDGRSFRDLRIDLNGNADFLAGSVSSRCLLREAGLDVGSDAVVIAGGQVGIHAAEDPVRAELMNLEVTVRGIRQAGFRGQLDATIKGEVTSAGVDLEIESALASGEFDAVPGTIDLRLGKPGRVTATFADELDWSAALPAVLLTAAPELEGFEGLKCRAMAKVEAGPKQIVVSVAMESELTAGALHLGDLHATGLTARLGAIVTMTPEGTRVATDGDAECSAESLRYGEFDAGKVSVGIRGAAEVPEGDVEVVARIREPVEFAGPALTATVSALEFSARGTWGAGGNLSIDGKLSAAVPKGHSPDAGVEIADARLELPFAWGKADPKEPGSLSLASVTVLGTKFKGPKLALRQHGEGLSYSGEWAPTARAIFKLKGDADLTPAGLTANTEFESAPFDIGPKDVLGKLLKKQTGVSLSGGVALTGRMELDRGRLTPMITIGLSKAQVTYGEDTLSLSNVAAQVTLDSFPPTTPGGQRVTWDSARVGEIDFGSGLLEFQIENLHALAVERLRCKFPPEGEFRVLSFRMDPSSPDLDIELYWEQVSLSRWLELIVPGKASGEGLLSGRLPVRIRLKPELQVRFAPGYLYGEPGGWFKVKDMTAVRQLLDDNIPAVQGDVDYSEVVKDRVVQALRDFEYSTLRFEIIQNKRDQTLRVTAIGKGRKIPEGLKNPQELYLTMNFNGFDTLIGTALKLKLGLDELFGRVR